MCRHQARSKPGVGVSLAPSLAPRGVVLPIGDTAPRHSNQTASFSFFPSSSAQSSLCVEDNKMVKWCPSTPHCGNAICVGDDECCEVECSCGLQFCFSCLSETRSPCSCLMWELWTKKCQQLIGLQLIQTLVPSVTEAVLLKRWAGVSPIVGVGDGANDTPFRSRSVSILVSLGGGTESNPELEGEGGRRGRRRKRASILVSLGGGTERSAELEEETNVSQVGRTTPGVGDCADDTEQTSVNNPLAAEYWI